MPPAASNPDQLQVALSIAGSDSGGGAGVQADLLTFAANGVFGTTAITCITAQNPDGVTAVSATDPGMVRAQAEQVASFFTVRAVKTGMLYNVEIIEEVAAFLESRPGLPAVVDPVMVSTSGAKLLKDDAIDALRSKLFPRAKVVTPNLDEAAVLSGTRATDVAAMERVAMRLSLKHGVPFLLKGGHLPDETLVDVLAIPGAPTLRFAGARITGVDSHGSGCTLSAAIAAHLALGRSLEEAVAAARDYLRRAMTGALTTGGRRFINHFP
ncbi:MAG TPA: bifunctional hydroxymethylpyrimidine kinase/phosphomethylpyrimidine kinase [Opitutaceae bacterium]|nr:bifunctional hydroxymethylpyrimidine kinase/phosphomethylpyrimidine kinase [Opitutaceae bacterium]